MAIQISNPISQPAVVFDKIHMTKLEILQPIFTNDALNPVYQVTVYYRHYGLVDGVRHFANEEVQRIAIEDFISLASQKAAEGNMELVNALVAIEGSIATIIETQTGTETTVI